MSWLESLSKIEDLEDAEFDAGLVAEFERRRDVDVLEGDAMRWARIEGNSLGLFSLVVMEDGGYELQSYERILTEDGLAIEFSRVKNGVVTRRIVGRTIRVE